MKCFFLFFFVVFFFFFVVVVVVVVVFQKTGFDIPCKSSSVETICIKRQILFTGKN